MDYGLIATVASAILAVISYYYESKYQKALKTSRDLAKAFSDVVKDFADKKLTDEEIQELVEDWKEVAEDLDLDEIVKKLNKMMH